VTLPNAGRTAGVSPDHEMATNYAATQSADTPRTGGAF
jgi:hypothetical protein